MFFCSTVENCIKLKLKTFYIYTNYLNFYVTVVYSQIIDFPVHSQFIVAHKKCFTLVFIFKMFLV